jgi:hypothetical protein
MPVAFGFGRIALTGTGQVFIVADAVLSAGFGSVVVELTLAVFMSGDWVRPDTVNVAVIVFVTPPSNAPSVQGNAVVQAPLLELHVSAAGVGSATTTFCETDGPLFLTVIV